MSLTTTEYKYIELNDKGIPLIAGTTMKVVELVEAQLAYGWSPAEIHLNHRYLTMSQILSALAYYWDHKPELDAHIQQREEYIQQAEQQGRESPFSKRIRTQGLR